MFVDPGVAGGWAVLVGRIERGGSWARWIHAESGLTAAAGPAELPAVLARGVRPATADALLGALIRLGACDGGDDRDAVLLVLHLLSDGALALARQVAHRTGDGLSWVVGELTCQIRAFPWRRRTRAYAANLLLDTKHALWVGELRPPGGGRHPDTAVPVDPTTWPDLDARRYRGGGCPVEETGPDLVDLLVWAAGRGVAPAADLALLLELEHHRCLGTATRRDIAGRVGIDERTLRRLRARTLTALRGCRAEFFADVA